MPDIRLSLSVMKEVFGVCQLASSSEIPDWISQASFVSITRTPDELSIVCPQNMIPEGFPCERDWKSLKVAGPLGFTLVGIMSALVTPLARANISIFALSTFETDYILVKERDLETAISTLSREGHWISRH